MPKDLFKPESQAVGATLRDNLVVQRNPRTGYSKSQVVSRGNAKLSGSYPKQPQKLRG